MSMAASYTKQEERAAAQLERLLDAPAVGDRVRYKSHPDRLGTVLGSIQDGRGRISLDIRWDASGGITYVLARSVEKVY